MFMHKRFLAALAISACTVVAGVAQTAPAAANDKIRMGTRLEYFDVNYRVGKFDEKYGLEAEAVPFSTGVEVITAIQTGEIDIASSGHVPMTILFSKTDKVIAIGRSSYSNGAIYRLVVPKNSPVKSIEDLKGKVIATKIGSGSYNAFLSYLKHKGLEEKDFKVKDAGPGAILAAMEAGAVDAGIWFDPTIALILYQGFGRVLLDFANEAEALGFWLVNREFAEKHPDIVVRFLAGAMDSADQMTKDPAAAAKNISDGYKARGHEYAPEVFSGGLPLFDFNVPIEDKHVQAVKETFDFFKANGRIKGDEPNWDDLINRKFQVQAQAIRK